MQREAAQKAEAVKEERRRAREQYLREEANRLAEQESAFRRQCVSGACTTVFTVIRRYGKEYSTVGAEDSAEEQEPESEYACAACHKSFKSEAQWKNHERSGKHKGK